MIINKSKDRILAHDIKVCRSVFSKACGLMFSRRIRNFGLIFAFNRAAKRPLHNMFVFFPIDIVFLNGNWEVVEIKENFRPFTVYFPKQNSQYIIELPAGTVAETGTGLGDMINFK